MAVPLGRSVPLTTVKFRASSPVALLKLVMLFNPTSVAETIPGSSERLLGLSCVLNWYKTLYEVELAGIKLVMAVSWTGTVRSSLMLTTLYHVWFQIFRAGCHTVPPAALKMLTRPWPDWALGTPVKAIISA